MNETQLFKTSGVEECTEEGVGAGATKDSLFKCVGWGRVIREHHEIQLIGDEELSSPKLYKFKMPKFANGNKTRINKESCLEN